jgi:hypothetical protein
MVLVLHTIHRVEVMLVLEEEVKEVEDLLQVEAEVIAIKCVLIVA